MIFTKMMPQKYKYIFKRKRKNRSLRIKYVTRNIFLIFRTLFFKDEPTLKSQFYENLLLIINKLQRQKIRFSTFSSGLIYSTFANGEVNEVREVKAICFIAKYTTKKTIGYNF